MAYGSSTNFAGISAHTCILSHRIPNSAHVSKNESETQIDTTMTFTILIVSTEQNEEFQKSRVHYTLTGIKSLLKTGGGWGFLGARGGGGSGAPGTLPWLRPCLNNEQNKLYAKYGEKPLAYELIRVWVRSVTSDLGALLLSSKL